MRDKRLHQDESERLETELRAAEREIDALTEEVEAAHAEVKRLRDEIRAVDLVEHEQDEEPWKTCVFCRRSTRMWMKTNEHAPGCVWVEVHRA